MNQKNTLGLNSCFLDLDDPIELFKKWMSEAEKKEINDPNALSLATATVIPGGLKLACVTQLATIAP